LRKSSYKSALQLTFAPEQFSPQTRTDTPKAMREHSGFRRSPRTYEIKSCGRHSSGDHQRRSRTAVPARWKHRHDAWRYV